MANIFAGLKTHGPISWFGWQRKLNRARLKIDLFHGFDIYTQGELYTPNEAPMQIIGIKSPVLTDFCTDAAPDPKNDLTETIFDTTTRADSARILLTNSTGTTRYLSNCTIKGLLVKRFSDENGYIHDSHVDYESIRRDGEKILELGNNMICEKTQVGKIADYHHKFSIGKKHLYSVTYPGTHHYFEVGEWYTLDVDIATARIDELMDMTCRCVANSVERSDGRGVTTVALEEVEEDWTFNANTVARFLIGGNIARLPTKEHLVVAASDYGGVADFYCDGTADHVEIRAAMRAVAGWGGGTVMLTEGHFYLSDNLVGYARVVLKGRGWNTVVIKNHNDYLISIDGSDGNEIEDWQLLDMKITRDASDANSNAFMFIDHGDNWLIDNVWFADPYYRVMQITYSDLFQISRCRFSGGNDISNALFLENCSDLSIRDSRFTDFLNVPIVLDASTTKYQVIANKVIDIDGSGMFFDGPDGLVSLNIIRGCALDGIVADDSHIQVTQNLVNDCGKYTSGYSGVHIVSGTANKVDGNESRDNGNIIFVAHCETETAPYIVGDGSSTADCTFERDDAEAYEGTYSFLLTKTSEAGAGTAIARQCDNADTDDLHEHVPGKAYHYTAWVKVPSSGGPPAAEVSLVFAYYDSASWTSEVVAATGQDAWEELDCGEITIPATATAALVYVQIHTDAENTELCYFDKFRLKPIGTDNEHETNFKDAGAATQRFGNSWQ